MNGWVDDLVDSIIELDMLAEYGAEGAELIGYAVRQTVELLWDMLVGGPVPNEPLT